MKRIIYSIFINIPNKDLDNPGWYNSEGVQQKTDKSKQTKIASPGKFSSTSKIVSTPKGNKENKKEPMLPEIVFFWTNFC